MTLPPDLSHLTEAQNDALADCCFVAAGPGSERGCGRARGGAWQAAEDTGQLQCAALARAQGWQAAAGRAAWDEEAAQGAWRRGSPATRAVILQRDTWPVGVPVALRPEPPGASFLGGRRSTGPEASNFYGHCRSLSVAALTYCCVHTATPRP